ncbi:DUF6285 domain-containing protein [Pacificispira sp.]|uniref:DUF6285 domain-containing protein n=1 Tax=Pacificispira sp. TaxID=2888761 RepID=UPI003BABCC4D
MIVDKPDSADLLRAAATVLKTEILPLLPEEKTLDVLMILAILGSAERDLADAGGLAARQASRLEAVLPGGDIRALCAKIRDGAFDEGVAAARLHAILMEDVRDRLELVNPKYLSAADEQP